MDEARQKAIRSHHPKLRTGLLVKNFLPSLHRDAGGFLTSVESVTISSKSDNVDQVDALIDILLTKEDRDFDSFCRILKENGHQSLSKELSRSATQGRLIAGLIANSIAKSNVVVTYPMY